MRVVGAITGRNLRLFFRDPMNVFFSLLGAFIVFLLYVLFLGNVQEESITAAVPDADPALISGFIDSWMFGGILALTTMTTPLGALGVFVEDAATGRFRDFLVSPLRRGQLVLGYLVAAFIIGTAITLIVLMVALLYLWVLTGVVLSAGAIVRSVGWIALSTAAFTALWAFVVSFLRSTGAFSALSTIVGTTAGFVAGAYIALGVFPETVREAVSALPFAQSAMLLRIEFAGDTLAELVGSYEPAIEELSVFYGLSLEIGAWTIAVWFAAAVLAAMTVVFTTLAAARIRSRIT